MLKVNYMVVRAKVFPFPLVLKATVQSSLPTRLDYQLQSLDAVVIIMNKKRLNNRKIARRTIVAKGNNFLART